MSAVHPLPQPAGVRILVVDDDARVRRAIANALSRIGFHVITADDGEPAIAAGRADAARPRARRLQHADDRPRGRAQAQGPTRCGACGSRCSAARTTKRPAARASRPAPTTCIVKPAVIAELRRRMIAAARTQQAFVESRLAARARRPLARLRRRSRRDARPRSQQRPRRRAQQHDLPQAASLDARRRRGSGAAASTLNALRRMSGLVANFVDIARFEDAAVKPRVTATNVRTLLLEVIEVHAAVISRGIKYSRRLRSEAHGTLRRRADRARAPQPRRQRGRYCNAERQIQVAAGSLGPVGSAERRDLGVQQRAAGSTGAREQPVREVRHGLQRQARLRIVLLPARVRSSRWKHRVSVARRGPHVLRATSRPQLKFSVKHDQGGSAADGPVRCSSSKTKPRSRARSPAG